MKKEKNTDELIKLFLIMPLSRFMLFFKVTLLKICVYKIISENKQNFITIAHFIMKEYNLIQ